MTARERLRRIAAAHKLAFDAAAPGNVLLASLDYAFDPAWVAHLADKPGTVVTREGVPVLAHVATDAPGSAVIAAMQARKRLRQTGGLTLLQIGRAHAELQSLMRISYAVFCLKKKKHTHTYKHTYTIQDTITKR